MMEEQQASTITIAIMSPGDMGHAIGRVLLADKQQRFRVITNLTGRSERTQKLSNSAKIIDVQTDDELVRQADIILSIVAASNVKSLAQRFASYLANDERKLYVDCNAVAPETIESITALFPHGNFVDGCIIGPPPRLGEYIPSIYFSGRHAQKLVDLFQNAALVNTRAIGPKIGHATSLKICESSMIKGMTAIAIQACIAARSLGVGEIFFDQLKQSRPHLFKDINTIIPHVPPRAARWATEMGEIAKTYENIGLSPKIFDGAADTYRFVAEQTPLGNEISEERKRGTTLDDAIQIMIESLDRMNQSCEHN
ncbi:unnamed protein product [Rotaria sp. Silwood1]|nr:unnamed protein product [Rotaria sp. Silwood1]CAF3524830.1 unnamed protein product [Rotaria sp. Silwood1]CAF3578949.1 unnamed protein product [Rotaria sp. Silwood1]CAF4876984.1 unnamed protein product [Rotaria sp. Silwood1]CAF4896371.1 unnamed protein product [Rotaria sp. Silwood1]